AGAPGGLEQPLRGGDVALDVAGEAVLPRQADAGLPGQVDDRVGPVEEVVERGGDEVELLAPVPRPAGERAGVRPLEGRVVVVGEGVDADDVVTAVEQRAADVPADEAGGPRHDESHHIPIARTHLRAARRVAGILRDGHRAGWPDRYSTSPGKSRWRMTPLVSSTSAACRAISSSGKSGWSTSRITRSAAASSSGVHGTTGAGTDGATALGR